MTTKTDSRTSRMPPWPDYAGEGAVLTVRDYFAAKAMQAILTRRAPLDSDNLAVDAYIYADAMLAARENT